MATPKAKALALSSLGIEIALFTVLGLYGGQWLDKKLGTTWLLYVGLAVGMAGAGRSLYRVAKSLEKDAQKGDD